ncbi:MAG TPA: FMN-binding protein [Longimicrobiales bacterium]|nr:FMN-binding protein [Longimicrobiales bacterium]
MQRNRPLILVLSLALIAPAALPAAVAGQARLTQVEALRLAFPPPLEVERRTAYMNETQLNRATELAGSPVTQGVVNYYVALERGRITGVAYFDSHRVRTHGEVLMFVVAPDATIRRVEVLQFAEPPDYEPPGRWLGLFRGKRLTDDLSIKRAIPNMSGATLTAHAVTAAARRVLALHAVIRPVAG